MHALTCDILHEGEYAYAMIPTYYRPDKFIAAKVLVQYAFHSESAIFYHCQVQELLDDVQYLIEVLPVASVRAIDKVQRKPVLTTIALPGLCMTKSMMLNALHAWHARYDFDIPAPFVVKDTGKLLKLQNDINNYFKTLVH